MALKTEHFITPIKLVLPGTADKVTIEIRPGGTGHWEQADREFDFT